MLVKACVLRCDVCHAGSCRLDNTMSLRSRFRTSQEVEMTYVGRATLVDATNKRISI